MIDTENAKINREAPKATSSEQNYEGRSPDNYPSNISSDNLQSLNFSPEATGDVHSDAKQETGWELDRLYESGLMKDKGRVANGWRYSFDFKSSEGDLSLSNGSFLLKFSKIPKSKLSEIKNLLLEIHSSKTPEKPCKKLISLAKKSSEKFDVEDDTNPDVMENLASELSSILNKLNTNASEENKPGPDYLRVKNGISNTAEANKHALKGLHTNCSRKEIERNPYLFCDEKLSSRDSFTRKITIEKLHGDQKKDDKKNDSRKKGNWDSVTFEQKEGKLFAKINAQEHIGIRSNAIARRTYRLQRKIEDKFVNRIERLVGGLVDVVDLVPEGIRKIALNLINKKYPTYKGDDAKNFISKAAPYLICGAGALAVVAFAPVAVPYITSALSAVAPYGASALSSAGSVVTSAGTWVSSTVGPTLTPYLASASSWFTSTFPAASSTISTASPYFSSFASWFGANIPGASGLAAKALFPLAVNGLIVAAATSPFLFCTRLGAKTIGGFGKLTAKITHTTKPTSVSFKIADLAPDEDMGSLSAADGEKILGKVEKVLKLLAEDKVTAVPEKKDQLKQLFSESYVKTTNDIIGRSSLVEKLMADEFLTLAEFNNAELNGLRWFGMGEHPEAVFNNCKIIDSNLYIFDADMNDCEVFLSKIYTGSENQDGRMMISDGYWSDTTAFFGSGCSLFFKSPNFYHAINPFDTTLRFKCDLNQIENMARIDYGVNPPQWYHPFQWLTFSLVYGGMNVNDTVINANGIFKKMFDDKEKDEDKDRRISRYNMYVMAYEFMENLSNPYFFPNMKIISPTKMQDVTGTVYEVDKNGYFIKVSSDLNKGNKVNSDYASPEMAKRILQRQLLERNGRVRKERSLLLSS